MRVVPKEWAYLSYNEMKVYNQTQVSVKSRHLLLFLYKISILIYAFLPALQNFKDASVVEVRPSSLQPASRGSWTASSVSPAPRIQLHTVPGLR